MSIVDAHAYIPKWSCETTVTTKIYVQKIESEHYSYPFK